MSTWALFSKKKNESWIFNGFTSYEELASEFEDDADEEEIRTAICLEDKLRS